MDRDGTGSSAIHCREAFAGRTREIFPQGRSRTLWRRICFAGVSGARPGASARLAYPATNPRRGGYRTIHSRPGAVDRNLHRICSRWRSGSGGGNRGDLSAVIFLCGATGPGVVQAAAITVDGGISRFSQRVRRGLDGRSNSKVGGRCVARVAVCGDCSRGAGCVVALESKSGVGGAGRWFAGDGLSILALRAPREIGSSQECFLLLFVVYSPIDQFVVNL